MITTYEPTTACIATLRDPAVADFERKLRGREGIRHRRAAAMILYLFQRLQVGPARDALTVRDVCDELEGYGLARETTRAAVRELYLDGTLVRIGKSGGWRRGTGYRYRLPLKA